MLWCTASPLHISPYTEGCWWQTHTVYSKTVWHHPYTPNSKKLKFYCWILVCNINIKSLFSLYFFLQMQEGLKWHFSQVINCQKIMQYALKVVACFLVCLVCMVVWDKIITYIVDSFYNLYEQYFGDIVEF